jgi:hypothetical protein
MGTIVGSATGLALCLALPFNPREEGCLYSLRRFRASSRNLASEVGPFRRCRLAGPLPPELSLGGLPLDRISDDHQAVAVATVDPALREKIVSMMLRP